MSHENEAGKARHFLPTKKQVNFKLTKDVRDKLLQLSIAANLSKTEYLQRLILKQETKK